MAGMMEMAGLGYPRSPAAAALHVKLARIRLSLRGKWALDRSGVERNHSLQSTCLDDGSGVLVRSFEPQKLQIHVPQCGRSKTMTHS